MASLLSNSSPSDIVDLCDFLFEQLHRQIEHTLLSTTTAEVSPKGFLQLLRSCLITLQFILEPLHLPNLVTTKCIDVLRKLCSNIGIIPGTVQDASVPASFSCAILEVFIHEFLVHKQLGKYFVMTDQIFLTNERCFIFHGTHGYMDAIMGFVHCHFILSTHDELALNRFIHSLSWSVKLDAEIPEIGLGATLALLGTPVFCSAPQMLQAHLLLLASRCIGIHKPTVDWNLNASVMNRYISAFDISVKLYRHYISATDFFGKFIEGEDQSNFWPKELSFGSCIRPVTFDMLSNQIDKLVDFCYRNPHGMQSRTEADIINNASAYIRENELVIDEMSRDDACLILNWIILNILPGETQRKALQENEERIQQVIYCLAAVLKLMSSSLLQIIWHMEHNGCPVGLKSLNNRSNSKEYDFISSIICYFGKFEACQPVQDILHNVVGTNHRFEDMKLMLVHFASLLSYSFRNRLEFLWRDCIFMMMATMNLLVSEEGNLNAFLPLVDNLKASPVPLNSLPGTIYPFPLASLIDPPKKHAIIQTLVCRRSSVLIASKLQSFQNHYLKAQIMLPNYEHRRADTGESTVMEMRDGQPDNNYCNGESFFVCLPEYKRNPSEFDDLVDFIACAPGKDYHGYLGNRSRFWAWRHRRREAAMRERRKKMVLKGVLPWEHEKLAVGKCPRRNKMSMEGVGTHTKVRSRSRGPGRRSGLGGKSGTMSKKVECIA